MTKMTAKQKTKPSEGSHDPQFCSEEKMTPGDLVSAGGQDLCSTTLSNEKTTIHY